MSPLSRYLETPGALWLLLTALLLLFAQAAVFLLSLREKKNRRQETASALHLSAGFLLFVILLDGFDNVYFATIPRDSVQTGWFLYSVPWLAFAVCEALSALILLLHLREYRRYKTGTVTPDAVRQTVDLLPEGICVSAADGTVRLDNLKMDALCRELTGRRLSDAGKFWSYLEQTGEDQEGKRLIHTAKEEVWLFSREGLSSDGTAYERINAINVTERYRITEELRKKNAHLQDIQRRMKEASELSGEMFVKQEEASARTALHNELGQVLLMGRHYLEHPESTDAAVVALMTKQMNSFLLGEGAAWEPETGDELQEALRMAESIGVKVRLKGELPGSGTVRSLLALAIRECAANTVKHAGGDTLSVVLNAHIISLTNNGAPPSRPVAESGGLLSLRRSMEAAGGSMIVESRPVFRLILKLPGNENGTNG